MKFRATMLATAALTLFSSAATAVDWNGYMRVGPGQRQPEKCYSSFVDGGTYRLGNECGTYGEFTLSQGAKVGAVDYKISMTNNFFVGGSAPDSTLDIGLPQLWVEGSGYDIAPNLTFWVGKRFWHRHDVHIVDTFYTAPNGTGAGVDGINLGLGTLGLAVFRTNDAATGANAGTRLNANLGGIATNPGGSLTVHTTFTSFSGADGETGFGLSLMHDQKGVLGGDNRLWLQYSQGSAYLNMGFGGATDESNVKRMRIVESIAWGAGPISGQAQIMFGRQGPSGNKESFNSLGGRVGYAVTKNAKVLVEVGTTSQKPEGGESRRTTHFTIAPTLSVGTGFWDRPELRFFVTSNRFNDAMRLAQGRDKSSESSVGFQAEIWF